MVILEDIVGTPGAHRRELARLKREYIKSAESAIPKLLDVAHDFSHNARISYSWSELAYSAKEEMKKSPYEYRQIAKEESKQAKHYFNKAAEMKTKIHKAKWGARADSTIAFCQIWGARVKKACTHLTPA